jgi:6-phosphogluconolactonase (cycloisomerase 2 family)
MRKSLTLAAVIGSLVAFAVPAAASAAHRVAANNAVYAITNSTSGNGVAAYSRAADGTLTYAGTYATGGTGTGAGLGSQGAVTLSGNGQHLFAVNAGSNSISEFFVKNDGLRLEATLSSNGVLPISVTANKNLLYVLNAGSRSITGFKIDGNGRVESIDGSTQPLLGTAPAQVAFSPNGSSLVVTEKGSRTIDTFAVSGGVAQAGVSSPSAGVTPFGFAFDGLGRAFVSEAAGSASSYSIDASGAHVISGAVTTHQGAPCWLVVTTDGRFAYTANAGGATISGFSIAADGSLTLLDPTGATAVLGAGAHPLDEAVSQDGRFLYVLVDGRHTIAGYRIGADGSLSPLGEVGTLPAGAVGLASS